MKKSAKRMALPCIVLMSVLLAFPACAQKTGSAMQWFNGEAVANEEFETSHDAETNAGRQRRSMFCWHTDFENAGVFSDLLPVLQEFGINRLYVDIPRDALCTAQTALMVKNLRNSGIEPVLLLGENTWGTGELSAYRDALDTLEQYNTGVGVKYKIRTIALDVEADTLPGWSKNPKAYFDMYISAMQSAYRQAASDGLRVVQIISTELDRIDRSKLELFLDTCCDELSLMNYVKETNLSAIWNEVYLCREKDIPVETIFETQPENEYYGVSEKNTYYYDGVETLKAAELRMQKMYGTELGVAFHHFRSLFRMSTGTCLGEIYVYADERALQNEVQEIRDSHLLLVSPDGTVLSAYLYRPQSGEEIRYLIAGVKPGVEYTALCEEMQGSTRITFQTDSSDALLVTASLPLSH